MSGSQRVYKVSVHGPGDIKNRLSRHILCDFMIVSEIVHFIYNNRSEISWRIRIFFQNLWASSVIYGTFMEQAGMLTKVITLVCT